VWLRDLASGAVTLVSAGANRHSYEPAVADGGTRVAFTSTAGGLSRAKPAGLPGVFVRDVAAGTTTLLSTHALRTAAVEGSRTARASFLCRVAS
jgi:hypothetical protein